MKKVIKSKVFWVGLLSGVFLSFLINFIDYKRKYDGLCMDCNNDFGLPFLIFQSGSIMHSTKILWVGLIANILALGLASFGLGLISYLFWNKFRGNLR